MKKILVTGANGQLGNEIKKISGKFKDFNFIYTDVDTLDITLYSDIQKLFNNQKFDFIINCAAYTNVDRAESDNKNAENINANAVANLAEISKLYSIPFIHISTDYVFDGNSKTPYKEDDKTNPQSVYGKTKLSGEEYAKQAFQYIIIRTSWLYSSFGNNFVKTMLRLGKEKNELNVVSDQIGSPTFAEDLANAILEIVKKIIENPKINFSGIYHFSNEDICSWYEFAQEIMLFAGLNCKINPISTENYPTPAERPKYSLLDKVKIKNTFNLKIPLWRDSLKRCLKELNEL